MYAAVKEVYRPSLRTRGAGLADDDPQRGVSAGVAIHRPGTIIGKALEPLEKGTGEILVLLSLQ